MVLLSSGARRSDPGGQRWHSERSGSWVQVLTSSRVQLGSCVSRCGGRTGRSRCESMASGHPGGYRCSLKGRGATASGLPEGPGAGGRLPDTEQRSAPAPRPALQSPSGSASAFQGPERSQSVLLEACMFRILTWPVLSPMFGCTLCPIECSLLHVALLSPTWNGRLVPPVSPLNLGGC